MKNMMFKDWVEEWLQFKKSYVKESTYANYLVLFKNQLTPAFGEYVVTEIDVRVVQNAVTYWLQCGRLDGTGGLSGKTVRDMVTVLKMCLRDYGKLNDCTMPTLDVEFPKNKHYSKRDTLSKEEQTYLLDVVKNNLNYETFGYALTLYTGVRIGELCALKWADVDMDRRFIRISKTLQRIYIKQDEVATGSTKIIITAPKSEKAIRDIPISNALYELLKEIHCQNPNAYLLTGNEKFIEPRLYRKHYKRFLEENHAEYIRFHGLRHTFATRCIESGADYKVVSELLGHASVNLTLNLYVHPQWEDKKKCVECI